MPSLSYCDILEDVDFVGVVHCKMQCLFFIHLCT